MLAIVLWLGLVTAPAVQCGILTAHQALCWATATVKSLMFICHAALRAFGCVCPGMHFHCEQHGTACKVAFWF